MLFPVHIVNPVIPHMDRTAADNCPLLLHLLATLQASCPFYTQTISSSSTSTTMALNKPHMGPSVAEPLIETSGDNFLEEQSDWRWTGMPITSDPESGLCWHESWPAVTFRVLYRPSVVLSHIGLPLMSTEACSHGPASRDLSGPEERRV